MVRTEIVTPAQKPKTPAKAKPRMGKSSTRLSYKEKREWEELPVRIEKLEEELGGLHERMADPEFFKEDKEEIRQATEKAQRLPKEIEELFARWAELDEREG